MSHVLVTVISPGACQQHRFQLQVKAMYIVFNLKCKMPWKSNVSRTYILLLDSTGPECQCRNETLPPCPDFGACAAITCGPGFSCEPCPCNCSIARCVPTATLPSPGKSYLLISPFDFKYKMQLKWKVLQMSYSV